MKQQNLVLRAAIASALGFAATQAGAAVNLDTSSTAYKVAKEIPTTVTTIGAATPLTGMSIKVPTLSTYFLGNPTFVRVDLSNGATFGATSPVLQCSAANLFTAAGVSTANILLSADVALGGANASFAQYSLTAATTVLSGNLAITGNVVLSGSCTITGAAGTTGITGITNIVTGGATRDVRASVTVTGNGFNIGSASGAYISFIRGAAAGFTASTSVIVNGANGSTNFQSAGYAANNTAIRANLGLIQFAALAGGSANVTAALGSTPAFSAAAATPVVASTDIIQSASITVNGPALAAAYAANGLSGIFLATATDVACANKQYNASIYSSNSVTFTSVSAAFMSAGVYVCLDVQGSTTQIATGQVTASIAGTVYTGVTADFSATSYNLANVTSSGGGQNKSAYFVNAAASTNKTSVLRLVNNSGSAGSITATVYSIGNSTTAAGTVLGTANASIGSVGANQSLTLTSADIERIAGFTAAPTDKYRVVFTGVGLANTFKVINFSKDVATGNLFLSQQQDD